jgi:hypothetical protein
MEHDGVIAVLGAMGRQGGAVARHLLAEGWHVLALTRHPGSGASGVLRSAGAEVARCDMVDTDSLRRVFNGVYGVYSVQNPMIAGHDSEVQQGKNVADAAIMPKLAGDQTLIPWLAVDDLGAIAARAFAVPDGAELPLAAEFRSIAECRRAWAAVKGRSPRGFPMPVWLFERFVGKDLTTMWRWLAANPVSADPAATAKMLGRITTVEEFLAEPPTQLNPCRCSSARRARR